MFSTGKEGYLGSVYIDLRHGALQTDNEFLVLLAESVRDVLQGHVSDLSRILKESDTETMVDMLHLVFDTLSEKKNRLLVVLDGFDFLPVGKGISPNLLDQLRSLVEKSSLCFVIGSRKRLRDLCKTEESRTSDFWRIFADPVMIEAFED